MPIDIEESIDNIEYKYILLDNNNRVHWELNNSTNRIISNFK